MRLFSLIVFVMLRENAENKKQHFSTPVCVSLFDVDSVVKLRELACNKKY